ncbi:UNVERIFIED_CONTAM: hypothetical protein HDU68_005513 [Siphonaria sp. JEL0065]|nr:hypothetical protein HDU68_005513 [Siphonaria sp. JEL0065]
MTKTQVEEQQPVPVTHASGSKRKGTIIIGAAVAIVVVSASLAGYFLTRNNGASGVSTGSANPQATATGGSRNGTTTKKHFFGYWGQSAIGNGVGPLGRNTRTIPDADQQKSLAYYCDLGYYQTMNIAFMHEFGGGDNHWGLDLSIIGRYEVSAAGLVSANLNGNPIDPKVFLPVGDDIKHCQSLGIKVMLSIGGDMHSPYTLIQGDGVRVANIIYNSFLQGNSSTRPFGDAVFDGVELDIEKTDTYYTQEQIIMLQTLKKLSPSSKFAAVPQCFLNGIGEDLNTGPVFKQHPELIDWVIIQYYNNPTCSYPFGFNFDIWTTLYKGPLVIGLAGDDTSAITGGFLNPGQLQAVIDMVYNNPQFMGISVYDVSSSNPKFSTYSQTLRKALDGEKVGSGYPPQGPFTTERQWAFRCAGTWNYANDTCGLQDCSVGGSCANPNHYCFMYLRAC